MIYYSYTADTSEFIGQGTAQPDPLESKKQGKEVFLLPRNATFTPLPEEKDGFARCWNGMAWEYVEDNRGTEYWLPADTWEAPAREMKELGALPDGALLERPVKSQEQIEKERLEAAKAQRAEAVQNIAVEVDGMVFDGNEDAQRRISAVLEAAEISGQAKIEWVLKNNTVAPVTCEQLRQVFALSVQKMQELWVQPYKESA